MEKCIVCGDVGEKHHIVFKNQGGFDFPINYVYLCSKHHRGKDGPHKNRKIDIEYKLNMQDRLFSILTKEYYVLEEIIDILNINPRQGKILISKLSKRKEGYRSKDIIKTLMGGKFYYQFMLDEHYDESWNILEEEIFLKNK